MALFSNKIETAKFVDHQEKTIEVLYKQTPESETLSTYILELNYNSQDFLDLLEEFDIEQIQDNTKEYYDNITRSRINDIEFQANKLFTDWIANAQIDLDEQDKERYEVFEKYKEEQLSVLQSEVDAQVERRVSEGFEGVQAELDAQIKERYKEADEYKEEQLSILQNELDAQIEERYKEVETYKKEQVESRIAEGFKDVDAYREKQLEVLQSELDTQIEERYKKADEYKEEQLSILQNEAEGRFKEADAYREEQLSILQNELDEQIKNRYKEADAYKEEQLEILQKEINEEAQSKHQEVEGMKAEFLKKFSITSPSPVVYSPEKVAKYIIDNFEDEDTIFKTKLEIFNLPEVKNSKNREMKMKVRKAKTVPEIFAAYYDIQHSNS
jgi:hypothetical protein